jgi:hypothetical protein
VSLDGYDSENDEVRETALEPFVVCTVDGLVVLSGICASWCRQWVDENSAHLKVRPITAGADTKEVRRRSLG